MRFHVAFALVLVASLVVLVAAEAAPNQANVSAYWKRSPIRDEVGIDTCFRGDFPRKENWQGVMKYDLPVALLITTTTKSRNEITGKVTNLPKTRALYRFNLSQNKSVMGPAHYRVTVSPNGREPCVAAFFNRVIPSGVDKFLKITGKMRIRASANGQFLGESSWLWENEASSGSIIWQGTDNFVNICINHPYEIRSSGGRLYCVQPGGSFRKVTRLA
jgi:hypothetical protein